MPSRQINDFFYKEETEKIELEARPVGVVGLQSRHHRSDLGRLEDVESVAGSLGLEATGLADEPGSLVIDITD